VNELADALARVAEHARSLVELEVRLALEELKRKAATLGIGLGLSGGALLFLWVAILFGLGAATAGLTYVMPVWAALLTMCGALLLVAVVLAAIGIRLMRRATATALPEQAIAEAQLTLDEIEEELRDVGTA
jgi:apolipoprotein N-acyltransferase